MDMTDSKSRIQLSKSFLTPGQRRILNYLEQEIGKTGQSPSLRQAAKDIGISHAAVAQTLKSLENKGVIRRDGRYGRCIHVLNRLQISAGNHRWRELPVIGRITAGLPMYAQQEFSGTVVVDADVFSGQNLFALRVSGDSMTDAGILDGDLAICEPRQYAQNGEIVVALIHQEEATVKRFFVFDNRIELRPENSRYSIMRYGFDEVLVQGKVVGIQRGPNGIPHLNR
jgi:repressor LexA